MDLKELHSFKMSDAVTFHNNLNPKLFRGQHLQPDVELQLKTIAQDFLQEMGIHDLDVRDVTISGSNAAYSYTDHSDLDLHILVNMADLPDNEVYREFFNAKKDLYNDSHDITINKIPVELYIQDAAKPVLSLGEYSIKDNKWLRLPTKRRANFDQTATKAKYEKLLTLIELALKSRKYSKVSNIVKTIKRYRQSGLDKGGEFGPENLAYKALRSQGYITKLYDLKDKLHSELLTIETMYQDPVKIQEEKNKLPPKVYHLTYTKNLPDIMQAGLRPQIGDRSSKVEGEHPAVFCFPDIATLEDAMMNWLGDEFDEDEQLALLEIDTRNLTGEFTPNAEYEVAITSMIPPSRIKVLSKDFDTLDEDYDPNGIPPGPEFKPTMPAGTVKVDVSDVYDWYKLGQHISNLGQTDPAIFGKGPPSTIMAFGSEPEEHKYITNLQKLGLTTTDIDPVDPKQPKGVPRQKTDPTYNVSEEVDILDEIIQMPPVTKNMNIKAMYNDVLVNLKYNRITPLTSINFPIKNKVFRDGEQGLKFFLFNTDGIPVYYFGISKFHDGYKTGVVAGSQEVQGQGLGWKLYKAVSDYVKVPLYSDSTQTDASRLGIWKKLIQNYPDQVVGYDQISRKDVPITNDVYQTLPHDQLKDVDSEVRRKTLLLKLLPSNSTKIKESSGYIPSEKEKNDPRFRTALTVDVNPYSIKKNAKAFSWLTTRAGIPPTANPSGKI